MKITKVKYFFIDKVKDNQPIAKCSVVFEDCLKVNDIKIFDGKKGKYIVFPVRADLIRFKESEKDISSQKNTECCHPVQREFYKYISDTLLNGLVEAEKGNLIYIPKN